MNDTVHLSVEEAGYRLARILALCNAGNLSRDYWHRALGAMEILLMVLGKINPGQLFDYIEIKVEVERVFAKNKTIKRLEHYHEHILRLAAEAVAEGENK